MKKTFIAVSTGQNISNLAPIIEYAEESDQIIWLESDLAKKNDWTSQAVNILEGRKINQQEIIRINDAPDKIISTIQQNTKLWQDSTIYLIGNGGTKLTSLAVYEAFYKDKPTLLYSNENPIEIHEFPHGLCKPKETINYSNNSLQLKEILAMSDHTLFSDNKGFLIWPSENPLPEAINNYGENELNTYLLHEQYTKGEEIYAEIGPCFEIAVARRIKKILSNKPNATKNIASIWADVKTCESHSEHIPSIQFDILIIMKNATLINVECKSFKAITKDLDARIHNTHISTSRLAKFVVCAPLYSNKHQETWFSEMHNVHDKIRKTSYIDYLPFTLPKQNNFYPNPINNNIKISHDSFEKSFLKILGIK